MDTWNAPTARSRQPLIYRLMESVGLRRHKMTKKQLTKRDRRDWKLSAIDPHDRDTWRSGVRSAMRAECQLPERGPLLWVWPLYLHVNKKSDDDDDTNMFIFCLNMLHVTPGRNERV